MSPCVPAASPAIPLPHHLPKLPLCSLSPQSWVTLALVAVQEGAGVWHPVSQNEPK